MGRCFRAERRDWIGTGGLSIPTDDAVLVLEFVADAAGSTYQEPANEENRLEDDQTGRFVFFDGTKALDWIRARLRTSQQIRNQIAKYRTWHEEDKAALLPTATEDLAEFIGSLYALEPQWRRAIVGPGDGSGDDQLELLLDWY
jgi:hypothetical protein